MWQSLIFFSALVLQVFATYNPSSECPSVDGPNSVYFPDVNCSRFWQCSNGVAYLHNCSVGLHFNSVLNVCDYPDNAGCDGVSTSTEKDTTTTTITTTTQAIPVTTPSCKPPPTQCTCTCEPIPEEPTTTSIWTTTTTPTPSCDTDTTTEAITTSASPDPPCDDDVPTTPEPTPSDCDEWSYQCPAVDGDYPVYIPLPDCKAFCQCSNGKAYYQPCPDGLHFNPTKNVCDWPQDAGCTGQNGTTSSTTAPCTGCSTTEASTPPCDDDVTTTPEPTPSDCDEWSYQCPAVDGDYPVYIPLPDCEAFCQCSNGKAYYQPCPDGLHFNPTKNVCDWPQDAGCTGQNETTSSTTAPCTGCSTSTTEASTPPCDDDVTTTPKPTPSDCDEWSYQCPAVDGDYPVYIPLPDCKAFCQCSNGKAYYQPCPDGLHFNPTKNVCDWPQDAGCTGQNGTKSSTTAPCTGCSTTEASTPPCDDDVTTTPEPTPSDCDEWSYQCPAVDGDYPVYIPLPDCKAFCQCSNGKAYYQPCPDGLHFNPTKNVCDWPQDAGCTGQNGTTSSTTAPCTGCSTTEASTPPCDDDVTTTPEPTPSDCDEWSYQCPAVDGDYPVYIPLPDCEAFCQCSNGKAYYQPCPDGLHFNPTKNVCDWPQDAGCTGQNGTTSSTTAPCTGCSTSTTEASTPPCDDDITTTPEPTPSDCDEWSYQCPAVDGDYPVYIPLPDCEAFCQCSNGKAYYQPCPDGLHFNPTKNVCDWPQDAGCTGQNGTTSSTTAPCTGCSTSTTEASTPPCDDDVTTTPEPTPSDCDEWSYQCPAVDGDYPVYIPLPDCEAFCQCSNGKAYYQPCPDGLHFNPTKNVCDWPQDAGCTGQNGTTSSTTAPCTGCSTSTTEASTPPCDDDTTTTAEPSSCEEWSSLCPIVDGTDPVYIALANCSAFCQCSNGDAYYQPCPDGLHFNPTLNVCDWPQDAGCTGIPGTTPSTEAPTTTPSVDDICNANPTDFYLAAHPTDCGSYVSCSNGMAVVMSCPTGLYYDPTIYACNWPAQVNCAASSA